MHVKIGVATLCDTDQKQNLLIIIIIIIISTATNTKKCAH